MSGAGHGERLFPLTREQAPAVDPAQVVWLSASAGTGKTQVLSARVLRLLLEPGVHPSQVLCLTFTKAGATEMAARIQSVLARWVRADLPVLARELGAIGADIGPETQARARRLFAEVLDCPGGGLRIDTIHAFAQWLLAAFPHEAGLIPGAKAMEDRDRELLLREVLAELLLTAERENDTAALGALEALSVRLGPEKVPAFLLRCASAQAAWDGPGGWQPLMLPRVRQLIGLASDAGPGDLLAMVDDDTFPLDALRCCHAAYRAWNTKTGQAGAAVIAAWLLAGPQARLDTLPDLHKTLFTLKDTVRNTTSLEKQEEYFGAAASEVLGAMLALRERAGLLALAEWLAPALELGWKFSALWDAAKARAGFIDFDDQIRRAAALLARSELSEWIRYKLDRRFDHVLVDEAQDTNAAQWQIIEALTGDFFSGQGQHGDKLRTLFVVGDYKQAIFRFQGTSPENFKAAQDRVRKELAGAADNLRGGGEPRHLQELGLGQSFRTARPILEFVDAAIAAIGPENFGLDEAAGHLGEERPGKVMLWGVVGQSADDDDGEPGEPAEAGDEGAETWLDRADRQLADRIALQVRRWLDHGFALVKGDAPRNAGPGDVMILVRKRKELAGLIVARLHAAGVPVAGIDRLRLAAPLAVRDLMAALRFAAQPFDDLNLACLLTSPLIGWSQDDLLAYGYRDPHGSETRAPLWTHLRRSRAAPAEAAIGQLLELLRIADQAAPQALLHWLLGGPWRGRRKLVARLGREANDPIDELLNAAGDFAATSVPSLVGFIDWFDAGTGEVKREAGAAGGEVRVMTVHGAKGLQAPIVILADAAGNPDRARPGAVVLEDPAPRMPGEEARLIPLPPLRQDERLGRIAEAEARSAREERQEHWRLLYVAMTRAEEALFVGGSLGPREKTPAPDSWYARLADLFDGDDWLADPEWGRRAEYGQSPEPLPRAAAAQLSELALLPPWLERAPAAEPRPPRPLAPSALGEELAADPPRADARAGAARRGVLLHRLLERLPDVPPAERKAAALAWLARSGAEFDARARGEMAASAIAVIETKGWGALFSSAALAEVPIAATVGGQVVVGTIDRLLLGDEVIQVVDFKTARRPPGSLDEVPLASLRQMAAYAAALEVTYPGRRIAAALLYTELPQLLAIPADLLDLHKQALLGGQ